MVGLLRESDFFPSPMLCEDRGTPTVMWGLKQNSGGQQSRKIPIKSQKYYLMGSVPKSLEQRLPLAFRIIQPLCFVPLYYRGLQF